MGSGKGEEDFNPKEKSNREGNSILGQPDT